MPEHPAEQVEYSFTVEGISDELAVETIKGREKLAGLYGFDVSTVTSGDPRGIATSALDKGCRLTMTYNGVSRCYHGNVASLSLGGTRAHHSASAIVFRLAPRLERLRHRVDSRIFQFMDVKQVIEAVLEPMGIARDWKLQRQYPVREYCTQYRETDLALLERLLAEEGLFYYFEQPTSDAADGSETIVFCDDVSSYPAIDQADGTPGGSPSPTLLLRGGEAHLADDAIDHFGLRMRTRSSASMFRDYDPARPAMELRVAAGDGDLEIYDHEGRHLAPTWEIDQRRAGLRLAQSRRDVSRAEARSKCFRLHAGRRFTLEDEHSALFDGEYVITQVVHEGDATRDTDNAAADYHNTFECVPADVAWVTRARKRARVHACLTGAVVGPEGEAIYMNAAGQIKVQLQWDRLGKRDENSSCWMRVMQAWAGAQWGSQFIPRVGMEVVVGFDDGNPDKPVVLGTLYNGSHALPFALSEKTKSGFVTQTYGGTGSNALVFDDAKGKEEVQLKAQKVLKVDVGGNHGVDVRGSQTTHVKGPTVVNFAGGLQQSIGGGARCSVVGARLDGTEGDWTHRVGGTIRHEATADIVLKAKQQAAFNAIDSMTLTVGGNKTGKFVVQASGTATLSATDVVAINSNAAIVFKCGGSTITVKTDSIELKTKTLSILASQSVTATAGGNGPSLKLDDEAKIVAKKVSVVAASGSMQLDDKGAKILGEQIQLDCAPEKPPTTDAAGAPVKTKPFTMQITDAHFKAMAKVKYQLLVEDQTIEGTTDGDGIIDQKLPATANRCTVLYWVSNYPTGPSSKIEVDLVDDLPPPDSVRGAKIRLRNLGYYQGPVDDQLEPAAQACLREVQRDMGLEATGQLDPPTVSWLTHLHP